MSYIITSDEYIDIDGVPLSTPAWQTLNLDELNNGVETRGQSLVIPRRPGAFVRARIIDQKIVNIPIIIYGNKAPDGTVYSDAREGLQYNLDLLKKALFNPYQPNDLTRLLTYHRTTTDLEAVCQTKPNLDIERLSPTTARGVITVEIPAGVLRDTTTTTINQWVDNDETFNIGVPGTADNYGVTFTIPGAANSLTITNNTTGASLVYNYPINTGLTIISPIFQATDGATNVSGKITTGGTPFWMPLKAGTNNLRVQRPGGASVAMTISFKAVYL
jgi:hypothetical protein